MEEMPGNPGYMVQQGYTTLEALSCPSFTDGDNDFLDVDPELTRRDDPGTYERAYGRVHYGYNYWWLGSQQGDPLNIGSEAGAGDPAKRDNPRLIDQVRNPTETIAFTDTIVLNSVAGGGVPGGRGGTASLTPYASFLVFDYEFEATGNFAGVPHRRHSGDSVLITWADGHAASFAIQGITQGMSVAQQASVIYSQKNLGNGETPGNRWDVN